MLRTHILDVNVNPYSLQMLIDYAECRMAAQYDDQDAGEIVQELLAKIFSDGALSWAVRHHYQSRSTHYSFRAHDHNAILAQLTPILIQLSGLRWE